MLGLLDFLVVFRHGFSFPPEISDYDRGLLIAIGRLLSAHLLDMALYSFVIKRLAPGDAQKLIASECPGTPGISSTRVSVTHFVSCFEIPLIFQQGCNRRPG